MCLGGSLEKGKAKLGGNCVNIGILWANFLALDSIKRKVGVCVGVVIVENGQICTAIFYLFIFRWLGQRTK